MPRLLMLNNPPEPEATYIIFPPAGGLASFKQSWLAYLPPESRIICIEYPERGIALDDKFINQFNELSKNICKNILEYVQGNIYFIGESMGGYLAFDIAQTLFLRLKRQVSAILLISVGNADNISGDMKFLLSLPKKDFENLIVNKIFNNNNPWKEFDKDTQNYFMELLHQDMQVLSTFRSRYIEPLPSLLMVSNGVSDTHCHNNNTKIFWSKKISKKFLYSSFLGGHITTIEHISSIFKKFLKFIR